MDLPHLYRQMLRARAYELAVEDLWNLGLISGEMHLGTGEEAVAVGVVTQLGDGDGLALTHRCSPALVVRGVPLALMLRELLGAEDGLCGGKGGHMHLFSKEHLAATSGIVGASLPTAAGFALANCRLRPGAIAVAFTGAGAMNQGMALETLNLAVAWRLPLVIVCIDNGWAITTTSDSVTGGSFLLATCPRLDGHFLGDPLIRMAKKPIAEGKKVFGSVLSSVVSRGGGGLADRASGMTQMMSVIAKARRGATRERRGDPILAVYKAMNKHQAERDRIDTEVAAEIEAAVAEALADGGESSDA